MRTTLVSLAAGVLCTAVSAQFAPLTLSGDAGSYRGNFALQVSGGSVGSVGAILLSGTPGPTPLALVNPGDPRSLSVGYAGAVVLPGAFLPPAGTLTAATFTVPGNPTFLDVPVYLQGFELAGTPLIGSISQPQPAWMAPAGQFRDRGVGLLNASGRTTTSVIRRLDQRMMLVGGGRGALWAQVATKTTEIYDPVSDSFVAGPNMLSEHSVHTMTQLNDGRWLLAGGVDVGNNPSSACEIYDPVTDSFSATASMSLVRFLHTADRLPDGRVLVIGGMTFNSISNLPMMIASAQSTTEIYDPMTGTWSAGPSMAQPRAGHATVPLPNGEILVIGGIGLSLVAGMPVPVLTGLCEIYDPVSNTFSSTGSMAIGRAVPAVSRLDQNHVMVAGGSSVLTQTIFGAPTSSCEIYDISAGTWSQTAPMATARTLFSSFDLGNGRFLHAGGAGGDIPFPIALASTEIYDAGTATWSAGPALPAAIGGYAGYTNQLGQIHLIGGFAGSAATALSGSVFYYR